jgi:hypothetical protein
MKNRIIYVLAWLLFLPFCVLCTLLCIPIFVFIGKSVFQWLDAYVCYLCNGNPDAKIKF